MKKKIFSFLIIILVVGVAVILLNKNENGADRGEVISDWQTYTNEEHGFQFQYPSDWGLSEGGEENPSSAVVSIASPETKERYESRRYPDSSDIIIFNYSSIADEPENKMNNLGATTIEEMVEKNTLVQEIGSTEIGGLPATEVVWGGYGAYHVILVMHNEQLFKIWFPSTQVSETERAILSTFTFID